MWSNASVLYLVRHGRTAANAAGLLLGRLDPGLDEVGRWQVGQLPAAVGALDRVIASPLSRTRETAAVLGLGLGYPGLYLLAAAVSILGSVLVRRIRSVP